MCACLRIQVFTAVVPILGRVSSTDIRRYGAETGTVLNVNEDANTYHTLRTSYFVYNIHTEINSYGNFEAVCNMGHATTFGLSGPNYGLENKNKNLEAIPQHLPVLRTQPPQNTSRPFLYLARPSPQWGQTGDPFAAPLFFFLPL